MDGMLYKLVNAFIFRRRDRYNRNAEHFLHPVYINGARVSRHFIHHIERNDHRNAHFKELHGKIKITFYVCRIDDIYYRLRLVLKYEVS